MFKNPSTAKTTNRPVLHRKKQHATKINMQTEAVIWGFKQFADAITCKCAAHEEK